MDSGTVVSTIAFTLIVLIGLAVVLVLLMGPGKHASSGSKNTTPPKPVRENFHHGNDFQIYNYLDKSIRVEVLRKNKDGVTYGKPLPLARNIQPRKSQGFKMKSIERNLTMDSLFRVYTFDETKPGLGEEFYSEYRLDVPEGTTIKNLHVGMITSRWVGADSDFNIGKPGLNAVQGLPWIKIHNMTSRPIALNNNINISPGGTLRYSGRDNFGVRLGTVFKDQDGVFPDYIFTVPATDVYYGVVSDIQQPLFGGFQLTPEFNDDPDEPQYLLESGWMGGPAWGHIPYGLLPIEGPGVTPQDRWGIPATPSQVESPVGPPVEAYA